MTERQELHCHECRRYVQFDVDLSLDGNHVLNCPNCGHEHCRVVRRGRITDIRWDQRNGPPIYATNLAYTSTSTFDSAATGNVFLYYSWSNAGSSS